MRSPTLSPLHVRANGADDAYALDAGNFCLRHRIQPEALIDVDEVDADCGLAKPDFAGGRWRQLDSCQLKLLHASGRLQSDDIGHNNCSFLPRKDYGAGTQYAKLPKSEFRIVRFCTMLDWNDLHHFVVLAREGTLSAAARALGVDHVTVARRVAALEAATALKLVDRRARSYALTEDGRRIAAAASTMEEAALASSAPCRRPSPASAAKFRSARRRRSPMRWWRQG